MRERGAKGVQRMTFLSSMDRRGRGGEFQIFGRKLALRVANDFPVRVPSDFKATLPLPQKRGKGNALLLGCQDGLGKNDVGRPV